MSARRRSFFFGEPNSGSFLSLAFVDGRVVSLCNNIN
jgi:hypothetical protein